MNAGPQPLHERAELIRWLEADADPPVHYLAARDLEHPPVGGNGCAGCAPRCSGGRR